MGSLIVSCRGIGTVTGLVAAAQDLRSWGPPDAEVG